MQPVNHGCLNSELAFSELKIDGSEVAVLRSIQFSTPTMDFPVDSGSERNRRMRRKSDGYHERE